MSKKDKIIAETNKIIEQYTTKLTIRQIYYRLVAKLIIPNNQSSYQYLVRCLVSARWDNQVRFSAIEDRTRQFIGEDDELTTPDNTFGSWLHAFKTCDEYHKLPYWLDQENYVEVWLEKQALQGLFQQVTDKWNVTLFPCRGYPSLTKLHEASLRLKVVPDEKVKVILYFGDRDPSGEDIPRQIEESLSRLGISTAMERIAITSEQIKEYNIPPMPAKASDPRYARFVAEHGDDAVEIDAIEPDILQKIIEEAIEGYFDDNVKAEVDARQAQERELIQEMIKKVLK